MADFEHAEELAVGLYERGVDAMPSGKIIAFGDFTLKSGHWSPWFVNTRPIFSFDAGSAQPIERQARLRSLFVERYAENIDDLEATTGRVDHLYGPPEAGTPLASAIAYTAGRSLLWRRVKDKSGRGIHATIEGVYYEGQKVLQIDDVISKATTKKEEEQVLSANGLITVGAAIGVDREMGGRQAMEDDGWEIRDVMNASGMFSALHTGGVLTDTQYQYLVDYTANDAPASPPADHPFRKHS
jgi:orotate phosphoribosyltransferase